MRYAIAIPALALVLLLGSIACDSPSGDQRAAVAGESAGAVNLRPGFSPGEPLTYEHAMEARESRTAPPGSPVVSEVQAIRQYTLQPVASEPDGGALVELAMQRVIIALRLPSGGIINIDTDQIPASAEDPQTRAIRALAGIRLIIAMDAGGRAREVRGLREQMQAVGALPEGMSAFFGEDWFRAAAEGAFSAADGETSADLGDEWTVAKSSPFADAADAATTTFTSRLVTADKAFAVIEGSARLEIDFSRASMVFGGPSSIDDQLFEFQKRWDLTRGCLLEHTTVQMAQMTVFMGGLRVEIDQTTASRLARLAPDGLPSTLEQRDSEGTEVNPGASEPESPSAPPGP